MDKKIIEEKKILFDEVMHRTEDGTVEYWYARELMTLLGYGAGKILKKQYLVQLNRVKQQGQQCRIIFVRSRK